MRDFIKVYLISVFVLASLMASVGCVGREGVRDAAAGELPVGIVASKPESGEFVAIKGGYMVPYEEVIPGTNVSIEMVPIPGGVFALPVRMEAVRIDDGDDGTGHVLVEIEPMWVGRYEITQRQYRPYVETYDAFRLLAKKGERKVTKENRADAVTSPTPLYHIPSHLVAGRGEHVPMPSMTPYAAQQYTKWLSLLTQRVYRLPSEAEWMYAASSGTGQSFPPGLTEEEIDNYAWHFDNSLNEDLDLEQMQRVGGKLANAWGLHDMLGNANEFVLDEIRDHHLARWRGKKVHWSELVAWPRSKNFRLAKGGSIWEFPKELNINWRLWVDDREWHIMEVNLPKSPWWFTNEPATFTGFRIVRPLHPPTEQAALQRYWELGAESDVANDVDLTIRAGRGVRGIVDPELPEVIEGLREEWNGFRSY